MTVKGSIPPDLEPSLREHRLDCFARELARNASLAVVVRGRWLSRMAAFKRNAENGNEWAAAALKSEREAFADLQRRYQQAKADRAARVDEAMAKAREILEAP